jgi:hypothetical protein
MGKMQRNKGVRGELEVLRIFEDELGMRMSRNSQEQYEAGGVDISVGGFSIEVKRCEQLSLKSWWEKETVPQAKDNDEVPCLIYRQSRQPWRVVLPAMYEEGQYCRYEETMTVRLQPVFIYILRETLAAEALSQMHTKGIDTTH